MSNDEIANFVIGAHCPDHVVPHFDISKAVMEAWISPQSNSGEYQMTATLDPINLRFVVPECYLYYGEYEVDKEGFYFNRQDGHCRFKATVHPNSMVSEVFMDDLATPHRGLMIHLSATEPTRISFTRVQLEPYTEYFVRGMLVPGELQELKFPPSATTLEDIYG